MERAATEQIQSIIQKMAQTKGVTEELKAKNPMMWANMIAQYSFTRKQQEALDTLLEQDEVLISATQSLAVSDATVQDILKNLPDSLSPERKKVIKAVCSLVSKVNYFWGVFLRIFLYIIYSDLFFVHNREKYLNQQIELIICLLYAIL